MHAHILPDRAERSEHQGSLLRATLKPQEYTWKILSTYMELFQLFIPSLPSNMLRIDCRPLEANICQPFCSQDSHRRGPIPPGCDNFILSALCRNWNTENSNTIVVNSIPWNRTNLQTRHASQGTPRTPWPKGRVFLVPAVHIQDERGTNSVHWWDILEPRCSMLSFIPSSQQLTDSVHWRDLVRKTKQSNVRNSMVSWSRVYPLRNPGQSNTNAYHVLPWKHLID